MIIAGYKSNLIKCNGYSIWQEDNVIFIYSVGLWGKSTAERFSRDYTKMREPLVGKPWSVINHSKNWVLGTPEIEPILGKLAKPEDNDGLVVSIRIVSENALAQFQMKKITENIPKSYFRMSFIEEVEAFNCLKEHGFDTQIQLFSERIDV
ncbi:hypothetical protein [Aliiglaciecola sp. LCG003]|uniref:hypothetical protein n=1 Tax=Aliiglaciecola sp. LCG003 TaxID=3053655 RepID=UPI0025732DB3|nr:hypothetical protein [Aliiglaciecola sp. LCG003]WJG08152.1 hypothetical protein QR722_12465 [Aliiglaciecola sp. LCG003]